ncbi:hypothetical protein D3C80_2101790 [compost metagenome]
MRSNILLNQPKKPFFSRWAWSTGLRMVAHKAGVKISATTTDRAIAETMVIENCR